MAAVNAIWVLGMMSGTSLDGVDGAVVLTDGRATYGFGKQSYRPYTGEERAVLRASLGLWPEDDPALLDAALTIVMRAHAELAEEIKDFELVGFHGQTLAHDPTRGRTHQLGDGAWLAKRLKKPVIWDFRSADMAAGGQGAPLAPFYHFALAKQLGMRSPVAFVNLGGVGNVTWVDPRKPHPEDEGALIAFDTGPANAPLNDLMKARLGVEYDADGQLAADGISDNAILEQVFENPYFERPAPKSLDRDDFAQIVSAVDGLSDANAAATLTSVIIGSIYAAQAHFPIPPSRWLICGGGRQNQAIMNGLQNALDAPVAKIDTVGFDGDMLEAHAFGYLATRSKLGLPLSAPGTTGCNAPSLGAILSTP